VTTARARWLPLLGAAGLLGPLFIVVFTVLGAAQPGYSAVRGEVSDLANGARGVVLTASFAGFGVLMLAFACGLGHGLRHDRAARIGAAALGVAGLALGGLAVFPTDIDYRRPTVHGIVHGVCFAIIMCCFITACLFFARAFRRDHRWRRLAAYSQLTGVLAPIGWAVLLLFCARGHGDTTEPLSAWTGAIQRGVIGMLCLWVALVSARHARLHLFARRRS
jgi:hypothetical membrane protein